MKVRDESPLVSELSVTSGSVYTTLSIGTYSKHIMIATLINMESSTETFLAVSVDSGDVLRVDEDRDDMRKWLEDNLYIRRVDATLVL